MLPLPRHLLELSESERKRIQELLSKSRGKLAVLIHPYFHEDETAHWAWPHLEHYLPRLEKLARSPKLPLALVLEESDRVADTHVRLKEHAPGRQLLYVPTHARSSTPKDSTWADVAKALHSLGARRLYLAGEYHTNLPGAEMLACVKDAEQQLLKHGKFESVRVLPKTVIEIR